MNTATKGLLEQCAAILAMRERWAQSEHHKHAFCGIEDLLFKRGGLFPPPLKPLGASKLRTERHCFGNCQKVAIGHDKGSVYARTYCEGFAYVSGVGLAVHHAWLITRDGRVFDPTWRVPGTAYFGVAFKHDYLVRAVDYNMAVKREWHSLLDDAPERFPLLTGATPIDAAVAHVAGWKLAERPKQKRGSYARR